MNRRHNYLRIFFLFFFLLIFNTCFAQNKLDRNYSTVLDSVKIFYGDTCSVGIASKLIYELRKYSNVPEVSAYLGDYKTVHKTIIDFRRHYYETIMNERGMILDLKRIFKDKKQWNLANICGIYFGPDSVTNLAVSYIIIRDGVEDFYTPLLQLLNFDQTFKKELTKYGKDWYYSDKLKQIKDSPVN